ncbi:hypothetical protein LDENG_00000240 [Lucifuga dentata]|nr:hypothetical protein LDENG_00000240 [Lucifuga dentata]
MITGLTKVATCHTCNKTSRNKGVNREFIATLSKTHGTPGSAGRHKAPQATNRSNIQHTPMSAGKAKAPVNTPWSTSSKPPGSNSSSSSSSKPNPKAKDSVAKRLSKILMREDNPSRSKGGLKDFLSAL